MNNIIKYLGILLLAVLIYIPATAQKIEAYSFSLAPTLLTTPGKIYVEDFENLGSIEDGFSTSYPASLKNVLLNKTINAKTGVKLYNPWITTKLYEVVGSEDEANYIIKGSYLFTKGNSSSYTKKLIYETTGDKLPIHYYKYTETAKASVVFNMGIYAKGNDVALKEFPFSDTKSVSKSLNFNKPAVQSSNSLVKKMANSAKYKYLYEFSPKLIAKTYKFKKVKPANKDLKKEYKNKTKSLKALASTGDINGMGKIFLEMLADDDNNTNVHQNLGICYELIGNYTKAKEHYVKSGNKSSVTAITYLITVKEVFIKLGLEVTENEF